ncbi:hypothetical protein E4U42_008079 [Claviceps africana]|uniref:BZIP domain-containing protein n=1 Tax=Claviceps africana TaxID=83212 RepID=A0A8K0JAH4_9HYPO|nr:hypothetical protein E4U42_008079 [Claviceps africana]
MKQNQSGGAAPAPCKLGPHVHLQGAALSAAAAGQSQSGWVSGDSPKSVNASGVRQDVVNHSVTRTYPTTVKITSQDINTFSTPSSPPPARLSVDLDFCFAIDSIRSSFLNTANISAQDTLVFPTDSPSTWLPNHPPPLPAPSAQLPQSPSEGQQDYSLFEDNPQPGQGAPNSLLWLFSPRQNLNHNRQDTKLVTAAAQNQRSSSSSQAFGQHPRSSVNANSFAQQVYASSAPSSSVSPNQQHRVHSALPPVPLFDENIGAYQHHQTVEMMNAADVDLDEFTGFEGGASISSSPAIPFLMGQSGITSSSASTLGTVSPHELLNHGFMSTPNSTHTSWDTPLSSHDQSPAFGALSPHFGSNEFDDSSRWKSLFPDSNYENTQFTESEYASTKAVDNKDSTMEPAPVIDGLAKDIQSSPSNGRHSSVAGVQSRRRNKPLSPIIAPDVDDIVAMKRHRNTLAARKSRARKASYVNELEDRIAKLEAEVVHWKSIASHGLPRSD